MVDRYCRLVCDKGVAPDAILAFTFTDKAAAELRQRIRPSWRAGPRRAPSGPRELLSGIGGAWVTTIHGFCNRLLAAHPVAAGIDPGFRVLDAPEAARAAREAFDEALSEFLAGDGRRAIPATRGGDWSPAYDIDGLRGVVAGVHAELRSRGRREPRLPEPPASDPAEALAGAIEAAGRGAGGAEGERSQTGAGRAGAGAARASPARRRGWTSCGRCGPAARRKRSSPTAKRSTRRSRAAPRPAREARPTVTWRHCWSCSRPTSRRPRSAAPGSTSRTCRSSPRDCWSGPRSARPTAAASATCWSTSSRTPTACSCG